MPSKDYALLRALANKELSKLSFADPLTKVSNRRYFDQVMEGKIKRASRTHQPLSVAIAAEG